MTDRLSCPRKRWGKTELSIPVVPFGTQGFGDNFGPVSNEEALALIRRAVDLGVNHFDCARCYGNSLSKLGLALKEGVIKRSEVIISGRVCHHSAAQWGGYGEGTPDYSAERTLIDVRDQLHILGIEKFDVLFLHDPPEVEPALASGGSLEGLEQARDLNLVDFIGFGMQPHLSHLRRLNPNALTFYCASATTTYYGNRQPKIYCRLQPHATWACSTGGRLCEVGSQEFQ